MRMSRVLLAGVAVAGAAVTTSAFTASNTLQDGTIAGYDDTTVTGATVTNIAYTPHTDPSQLASVAFTATGDITDTAQTMVLRLNGSPLSSTSTCAEVLATNTTVTCTLTTPLAFTAFDGLALTVVSQ